MFLTHNPEDRAAYYGRSLAPLREICDVVLNPTERDLETSELIEAASGCEVIVAHRSTPGEAALFEQSPDLVAMLRCAIDISTIDVDAASAHGVLVANADKSFIPSTAELAVGLTIAVARHIAESAVDYRAGEEPPQRPGIQLRGRTAGIIGYGSIGRYLAEILQAIGMRVLACDPSVDDITDPVELVGFDRLLAESDVVFPLTPGGAETTNLIGRDELAAMRPGSILVNVSRGEVLDDDAVIAALESGHLRGVGLDVGRAADQRPASALASRPDVVATPHLGGLTPANADAQAASSVEQVRALIEGRIPPRTVNAEAASRARRLFGS